MRFTRYSIITVAFIVMMIVTANKAEATSGSYPIAIAQACQATYPSAVAANSDGHTAYSWYCVGPKSVYLGVLDLNAYCGSVHPGTIAAYSKFKAPGSWTCTYSSSPSSG